MKSTSSVTSREILIIALLAGAGFMILTKSWSLEKKWVVFLMAAPLTAAAFAAVTPEKKVQLLLFSMISLIPVGLDYHPYFYNPPIILPVIGFYISMWEVPFWLLLMRWFVQMAVARERSELFLMVTVPLLTIWIISVSGIHRCIYEDLVKFSIMWRFALSIVVLLYLANNIKDHSTLKLLILAFLGTIIPQAIVGLLQTISQGLLGLAVFGEGVEGFRKDLAGSFAISRVGGTLGSPNSLAVYLALILPLGLSMLFAPLERNLKRRFILPMCILGFILLIMTYSRGGWIATIAGGGTVILWCMRKTARSKLPSTVLSMIGIALLVVTLVIMVEPIRNRIFEHDYDAAHSRIPMAQVALHIIEQHPFTGVGFANYTSVSSFYDQTEEGITYTFKWPVHNEFLLVASELGLPALGLLIFIMGWILFQLARVGRSQASTITPFAAIGLFGGIMAYLINRQFDFDYVLISIKVWIVVAMSLAVIKMHREELRQAHKALPSP